MTVLEEVKIQGSSRLSVEDISTLTLLYQPLISTDAYSLFLTMYELVNVDKLQYSGLIKHILHLTNFTIKELDDALAKLEAVGLVNSYYATDKGYLFDLNHPLGPNEFMKDGSLGIYLYAEIGEEEFKKLQKRFKVITRIATEYNNITRTFDDVFTPTSNGDSIKGQYQTRKSALLKFNSKFDFSLFESLLSKSFYTKKERTEKLVDTINKLAFTYDLDEQEMAQVYTRSLNSKGVIDYRELPKETRKQYQYRTEKEAPRISFNMNKANGEGLINHLKSIQPKALLKELSGMEPPTTELDIAYKLYSVNKMDPAVINLLIYYVLKVNKGKMPNYAYFNKIANEWGRLNLDTIEKANDYIVKENQERKKNTYKKTKNTKKPDWSDELKKEQKQRENSSTNKNDKEVDLEALADMFKSL